MRTAAIAGVRGSRSVVAEAEAASGRECCVWGRRQGVVPVRLFGDIVRVMA